MRFSQTAKHIRFALELTSRQRKESSDDRMSVKCCGDVNGAGPEACMMRGGCAAAAVPLVLDGDVADGRETNGEVRAGGFARLVPFQGTLAWSSCRVDGLLVMVQA
jgi:hypothetical protein